MWLMKRKVRYERVSVVLFFMYSAYPKIQEIRLDREAFIINSGK